MDAPNIYAVPLDYHAQGLDAEVLDVFGIRDAPAPDLSRWEQISDRLAHPDGEVTIAVVGKYTVLKDAYKSLIEALIHGGVANRVKVNLDWVESETFEGDENAAATRLEGVHGILVPGGFGERGSEGKIRAAKFARERPVPYFGVCFGMQMAVIEATRNVAGIPCASSTEFGPTKVPVVGLMTEWVRGNEREIRTGEDDTGRHHAAGRLRGGADAGLEGRRDLRRDRASASATGTATRSTSATARRSKARGLKMTGVSPDGVLPEIVERADHPWFIGVQFHPELKSRPFAPHPLFASFIAAALEQSRLV